MLPNIFIHRFAATLLAVLIYIFQPGYSQGFLKTSGNKITDQQGNNILLRGIGLGGWMLQEGYMLRVSGQGQQHIIRKKIETLIGNEGANAFYESWLAGHTTRADIDSMKAWGFNSVRLPMHYNLYTLPVDAEPVQGKHTWIEKGFRMTDSLLAWCRQNKMYLILDLHAAPGGQGNDLNISDRDPNKPSLWQSRDNQEKTIALWRKLAEKYKNEPWIAAYDIINEPNWGFDDPENDRNGLKEKTNAPLRKLLLDITAAIREVDKKHIIIIEGNGWGNNYNGILPPWDNNMVLSYHKYWNYNNQASIQHLLDTRAKYNVPVWLGETGENSNVWFTDAIRLLEQNNIGWAWWPLKKIGVNNPVQIKSNPGYDSILRFWEGKGAQPNPNDARKALLQLAADSRIQNAPIQHDVIDAMIRQPFNRSAKPFKGNVVTNKRLLIAATDYDLGANGVAYFDLDTADYHISDGTRGGNRGRTYRNDGVDIRRDSLSPPGNHVFSIESGEWLQYSVVSPQPAKYTAKITVCGTDSSRISFLINEKPIAPNLTTPLTGKEEWRVIEIRDFNLPQGTSRLRLLAQTGGYLLKSIELVQQ